MNLVFQFPDFQSFMWMNGHGPYVWGSYGVTFLALAFLALEPIIQRRRFIRQQKGLMQRQSQLANEE